MSEREAIRLVIASNQPIVRHGLGSILMAHDHLRLIGEAEDGTEAIQLCEMLRPALAIIGTQISDPDSIETTRTIRQRWPDIHVLVLAGPPDLQVAQETLEAGAAGVLTMQLSADELVDAITQAADGRLATASTAALTILRAEHLAKMEDAVRREKTDPAGLPHMLSRHLPKIFPDCQIQARLFPNQDLLTYPSAAHALLSEAAWTWLRDQDKPMCFSPGEKLPWGGEQRGSGCLILGPIHSGGLQATGGIGLALHGTPDDLDEMLPVVQSIASIVASALKKAQDQPGKPAQQSAAQELKMAGRIQAGILPESPPSLRGWDLAARILPARETSGDFYDFIPLMNGKWGIVIADVTDKGLGAAVFMALCSSLIRTYAVQYATLPAFSMSSVNERILSDTRGSMFVTAFYGVLEPESGRLRYVNAGHNPPFVLSAQKGKPVDRLYRTGMALGILNEASWQQKIVKLNRGDVLLLYTDGITEAQNRRGEQFGEKRLQQVIRPAAGRPAKEILDAVLAEVRDFTGGAPAQDDITLVALARKG